MATTAQRPKVVVIVGATASGKSDLGMKIAKDFNGEIVSADSRMVYRGMDIGTGKPTKADQRAVPHHLLDVAEVNSFFSAADYKARALAAIEDIQARGKLPVLVGGSGLYIDSVLFDFDFRLPASAAERQRLNALSLEELHAEIKNRKLTPPLNYKNKRHLIRTLETGGARADKKAMRPNTLVIGISMDNEKLKSRISARNAQMIKDGLEAEVRQLTNKYGRDAQSLDAIGYREWQGYFEGNLSRRDARDLITKNSITYAKRQKTWFKRNPQINWFNAPEDAEKFIRKQLLNT